MKSQVTQDMLVQLAHLANLECSEKELEEFAIDLERITSHFETLQSVQLNSDLFHQTDQLKGMPMREDIGVEFQGEKLLKLAPERIGDLVRVPPVLVQE